MVSINNLTIISIYRLYMIIEKVSSKNSSINVIFISHLLLFESINPLLCTKSDTTMKNYILCCTLRPTLLLSAMYQPPPLLADPGEPGLGAGGPVRLAARHGALGPLQSHGEWDEVGNLCTK